MQSTTRYSHTRALSTAAERQMRNWALEIETQQSLAEAREHTQVPQLIHPYVAISRETGVDAGELAQKVADRCNWKLLDRELLNYLAEQNNFSRLALEFVDEKTASWFHEMFGKWLDEQLVSQAEYVSRLGRLILLAAQHESTVIVGRGAQFMLPRDRGLAVRIIAPERIRIQHVMDKRQCNRNDATRFVRETDNGRAQFVQRYFHRDIADPRLYDLVINLENVPRDDAVRVIVAQAKRHQRRALVESSGRSSAQRQFRRLNESTRPR